MSIAGFPVLQMMYTFVGFPSGIQSNAAFDYDATSFTEPESGLALSTSSFLPEFLRNEIQRPGRLQHSSLSL
jgi:hypothetical protein